MKALFVRRMHLWPRFAAHVKEGLDDLPHTEVCASHLCSEAKVLTDVSSFMQCIGVF